MDATAVSAITGAVDFASIVVGIGGVFAALVIVRVAMVGGKLLISAIR